MHPGRTANISINGEVFGYVGELHPQVASNYNIGAKTYIAVIDMAYMIEQSNLVSVYKPLPKFPAITRDISMLIKDDVIVKDIENVIKKKVENFLKEFSFLMFIKEIKLLKDINLFHIP